MFYEKRMNTISYYYVYLLFSFLFIHISRIESSQTNNAKSSLIACESSRQTSCFQVPKSASVGGTSTSTSSRSGTYANAFLPSHATPFQKNGNTNNIYPPSSPVSSRNNHNAKQRTNRFRPLSMSLLPIPVDSLDRILTSRLPTPAQYSSYWGRTSREQYNAGFEAFGVSFLGVFTAYFLSFAFGQFIATILGMVAASWLIIGPEIKAYQRNWELTSGRDLVDPWIGENDERYEIDEDKRGLYGAFYLGRIDHICVVDYPSDPPEEEYSLDEFEGYTMEDDEQERESGIPRSLRLLVTDEGDFDEGRELQIHTRMSEEYLDLEVGMPVCAVLLSTSQRFESLTAITDFCVPDAGPCWVGDYPYLDRPALEEMFVRDRDLWDDLRDEGRGRWDILKD